MPKQLVLPSSSRSKTELTHYSAHTTVIIHKCKLFERWPFFLFFLTLCARNDSTMMMTTTTTTMLRLKKKTIYEIHNTIFHLKPELFDVFIARRTVKYHEMPMVFQSSVDLLIIILILWELNRIEPKPNQRCTANAFWLMDDNNVHLCTMHTYTI